MRGKLATMLVSLMILSMLVSTALVGCGQPTQEAQPTKAPAQATEAPAAAKVVNSAGVELPADAAPIGEQVFRRGVTEYTWSDWSYTAYDTNFGLTFGLHDSCVRPDKEFQPQPSGCESWEVSDDGLVWTFHLPKDKVWSDGTPVTAEDWVFTLQRMARPDYDFEWFYSMGGIVNWDKVASDDLPPEELGAKVVDDYTWTATTNQPSPFLVKQFADLWVVPKHIVKDRMADGSWAADPATAISAGPYKLDHWTKGVEIVWVPNDKYTGPFPPMMDKVVGLFMDPEVRFPAYENGELDILGYGYEVDVPPASLAKAMADPELKKQLISWANFITYYLFFDTWNEPFDNLKVRQAFSHAIDRDAIVNGPLQYQSMAAYTMNPPGFDGENVDELKSVQNFDPELAASLMEEAGYPGGEGFPKLTMYTREAYPALTNAGEVIAAMLKENIGVDVEIQDQEYDTYMEMLNDQKRNESGDFLFALVPYEYDFVDGSNLLSVWGSCETGGGMPDMPGRHTWYNKEYNELVCEGNSTMGDPDRRTELYKQAERILIEDVGMIAIYHGVFNVMVNPKFAGPALEPNKAGVVTFRGTRFNSSETTVYKTK